MQIFLHLALPVLLCSPLLAQGSPQPIGQGYVYANYPMSSKIGSLTFISESDKKEYELVPKQDGDVFSMEGWLPPGDYRLSKWGRQPLSGYPKVVVKSGQLINLGTFVSIGIGDDKIILLPVAPNNIDKHVKKVLTDKKDQLTEKEVITWTSTTVPSPIVGEFKSQGLGLIVDLMAAYDKKTNTPPLKKRLQETQIAEDFLKLAKSGVPPITLDPGSDELGTLYYGAELGQIRTRTPKGEWASIDTGVLNQVTSVRAVGEVIYAGFDDGTIRLSRNHGITWAETAFEAIGYSIEDIAKVGDDWVITAFKRGLPSNGFESAYQLRTFVGKMNDLSGMTAIAPIDGVMPNQFKARNQQFNKSYYLHAFPHLYKMDANLTSWIKISPAFAVGGFNASPSSGILAAYRIQGMFSKLAISQDGGTTWTKRDNPPYAIMNVNFETPGDGHAVRWRATAFSGILEVLNYQPANDTWVKESEAPKGCIRILLDLNHQGKFFITQGGNILSYEGSKWTLEFAAE